MWLAVRARRVECEQACDDGVVVAGVAATDYAEHLVEIARGLNEEPILEGGVSMAKQSTLEQRLRALLDPMTSHRPLSRGMLVTSLVLGVVMLASAAGLKLIAQTPGGVRGVVKDASGATVAGARVTLRFLKPSESQRIEVVRSSASGEFAFPGVPDGDDYAILVEKEGFAALSNTMVKVGAPLVFTLNLGGLKETIHVSAGAMPPPPPPPPGTMKAVSPSRIRVGGNVQSAKLLYQVRPIYPAEYKKEGVSGIVLLMAVIGKEGDVVSLEPVNQLVDARLRESAMNAVKLWRYQPTLLNGNAVEVMTQVEVNFTLAP